jgi:glycosyltransferase involved in cell wall biosynthesis
MIRLYGTTMGYGSFARVTAGVRAALEELKVLAGVVPLDAYDGEMTYDGWDAPVAVYIGNPLSAEIMTTIGDHAKRYVLLPPNSTWMPLELLQHVAKSATHLLAPSRWAHEVHKKYAKEIGLGTSYWAHGVDLAFRPWAPDHLTAQRAYENGHFKVLHMTSTVGDRKGTGELIEAWQDAVAENWLGPHPELTVVVNAEPRGDWRRAGDKSILWALRGHGLPEGVAAQYYRQFHVVCQPSRGEGFGLVPLEARCCGVPVVVTACTGHEEHVRPDEAGVVEVPHGPYAPTDDGPGATSPSVAPASISRMLRVAHANWQALSDEALLFAEGLRRKWTWTAVTKEWLEREKGAVE